MAFATWDAGHRFQLSRFRGAIWLQRVPVLPRSITVAKCCGVEREDQPASIISKLHSLNSTGGANTGDTVLAQPLPMPRQLMLL